MRNRQTNLLMPKKIQRHIGNRFLNNKNVSLILLLLYEHKFVTDFKEKAELCMVYFAK